MSGADAETVALGHGAVSRSDEYAAYDVAWLKAVLAWAVGAGLLDRNPLIGYSPPSETSPRRPIVTTLEYEALLRASDRIHPLFRLALIVVHETGHRIGAVPPLRSTPGLVAAGAGIGQAADRAGRGWHSLRRQFATEMKYAPLKDLCALGGWKSPQTVLTCYQRADAVSMQHGGGASQK